MSRGAYSKIENGKRPCFPDEAESIRKILGDNVELNVGKLPIIIRHKDRRFEHEDILRMHHAGMTSKQIAEKLGCHRTYPHKVINLYEKQK